MLIFECSSCKAKMQAAEEHAGKTTSCPSCGTPAKVPMSDKPAKSSNAEAITAGPMLAAGEAITNSEPVHTSKKRKRTDEGDDDAGADEDERPRRRDTASSGAKTGMSIGIILLLVFGVGGCVMVAVGAILIALLVPAVQKVREAAARTQTMNNMKQIGIGIHQHHDTLRFFPSPKMQPTLPAMNPPELSWRVAILPFIEQAALFNQFDRTKGWDQANNQALGNTTIKTFESLMHNDIDKTQTRFQYFTGPNTAFPSPLTKTSFKEITDGLSNTFLAAESANPVPWAKPADMAVTPNGPLPLPANRFIALFGDGSTRLIERPRTSDASLRLLIDPRDGQIVPLE